MNNTYELYNGKVELHFDEAKHMYSVNDKTVVGVTGVTSVISKPALMYWAVNQAVEFLGKTLKAGKSYDEIQINAMLEGAKFAHRKKATTAADIGTITHEAIEIFTKTGQIKAPVNEKAKSAFNNFVTWAKEKNVKFLESERKIFSKEKMYAGTMDFYCKIGDKFFVGDSKTSTGIYDEYWFQTAGYQQAYQEETGAQVDGHIIVRVGKDGSFEVQENYDYNKNILAFNGALALYKRTQELKNK